jgi:hypothetical protein
MLEKFAGIMAKQYFHVAAMKPDRKEKRARSLGQGFYGVAIFRSPSMMILSYAPGQVFSCLR